MKIATSTVSYDGYKTPAHKGRWQAFARLCAKAKTQGVHLLCLPGGYFSEKSEADLREAKKRIGAEARKSGIAVAVGVDIAGGANGGNKKQVKKNKDALTRKQVREQKLPYFAIAWSPEDNGIKCWRQRSTTSDDQRLAPCGVCGRSQTLCVAGKWIEILMCGELFNQCIRNAITNREPRPTAVLDLSHEGKGFRPDVALRKLAGKHSYALVSTHANRKAATKRGFGPGPRRISCSKVDFCVDGPPRIEAKVTRI